MLKISSGQPYLGQGVRIEGTLIQRILEQGWGHSWLYSKLLCLPWYPVALGSVFSSYTKPVVAVRGFLLPTYGVGFFFFSSFIFSFNRRPWPLALLLSLHHINHPQSPMKGGTERRCIIRKWALFPLEVGQQNLHPSHSISILRITCKEISANCS